MSVKTEKFTVSHLTWTALCLLTNTRSCYCQNCLQGESGNCCNVVCMDEWRTVEVDLQNEPSDKETRSEPLPDVNPTEMIAEMATTDSVVALAAEADPNYDYYLLKVTSDGIQNLKNIETDNYGTTMAAGSKVLRGCFFVRENLLDMTYKLQTSKSAIVHTRTIRCICFDLAMIKKKGKSSKTIYKVSLQQHEEIMGDIIF